MNLTGLAEDDTGLDRLVVEPLVAAGRMPVGVRSVVDIGSGGGSPAVPMKLAQPGLMLRMVESRRRKAAFLREVTRQLGLKNVVVEACRYEALLTRPELHETADVVTVRAVAVDGVALEGLQALLRIGGRVFLFLRGGEDDVAEDLRQWQSRQFLQWRGTYPLVDSLKSRLVVLEKA